jgi:hypothetical protein
MTNLIVVPAKAGIQAQNKELNLLNPSHPHCRPRESGDPDIK